MRPAFSLVALALSAASPAAAGDVLVVDNSGGPGADFAKLQPAIDAAADGDIILVRPGIYGGFVLEGKSLTIHGVAGDDGAKPYIGAGPQQLWQGFSTTPQGFPSVVENLSTGEALVLRGLQFEYLYIFDVGGLLPTPGGVWMEDCVFGYPGSTTGGAGVAVDHAVAVLFGVESIGSDTHVDEYWGVVVPRWGLLDHEGIVAVEGGWFQGGSGGDMSALPSVYPGNSGARVLNGKLLAASTTFRGGHGGTGYEHPTLCISSGDGAPGLSVGWANFAQADCLGVDFQGGSPGPAVGSCPDGSPSPTGAAGGDYLKSEPSILTVTPGEVYRLASNSPVHEGEIVTLSATPWDGGAPTGTVGFVLLATTPSFHLDGPISEQLYLADPLVVAPLKPSTLTYQRVVPELGAGVQGVTIFAQGGVRLQSGEFVRTSPTAVLLLDSAF